MLLNVFLRMSMNNDSVASFVVGLKMGNTGVMPKTYTFYTRIVKHAHMKANTFKARPFKNPKKNIPSF